MMADNTNIEWCDHTFNPWEGCQKVAPECDNCYAETRNERFHGGINWGPKASRRRTSPANWRKPHKWQKDAAKFFAEHGRRQRVFCASLADVFDNHRSITSGDHGDLWALIEQTPDLDWLLLTKRPQNIKKMLPETYGLTPWGKGWPNVWLGVSAGTQKTAGTNIPHLLATPAAVRFVSCEPMLGPVDLTDIAAKTVETNPLHSVGLNSLDGSNWIDDAGVPMPQLDWIICGGESGPNARPMHPDWARSLRDQCADAGVPFLFKQWGEWVSKIDRDADDPDWRADYGGVYRDPKKRRILNLEGGWGFHGDKVNLMQRVGKKAAGRELDGVTHDGFPNGEGA